ncbi:NADPH-dependent FMN reductase [Radiobacillus sp. PE A8.2]|uniref:NADPH-dependent FMN reductase n=1 Tax=Radiobacillus sp. PE A8.2 TaxID=3380349 RepID=UPI00388ED282
MSEIVILSGSPSVNSRSDLVLRFLGRSLQNKGFKVTHVSIKDVPQDVLFEGKFDSPVVSQIAAKLQGARGVIVGSPVYKAAYTGVLKALIDLLPQDVLEDTPVFPLMTGGSPAHMLAIEYTLKPLLATLKGQNLKGVFVTDNHIDKTNTEQPIINIETHERLTKQLAYFVELLNRQKSPIV